MPARSKARSSRRTRKNKKKKFSFIKLLIFTALIAAVAFFFLKPRLWSKKSRLVLVINKQDGGAAVIIFDPAVETITTINIPEDTQVEASKNLGTWRLNSIWKLGEQEGYSGTLLAETITKSLRLGVEAWADTPALGFADKNLGSLATAALSFYKTNLSPIDRINLALFALGVKNPNRVEIALDQSGYLNRARLPDGHLGYEIRSTVPKTLASLFADTQISKEAKTILITDSTGKAGKAQEVGEIITVMGTKIVSINKQETQSVDCEVVGDQSTTAEKISRVFSCKRTKGDAGGNFDIEIIIGEAFAQRF